ncbi:hypothetical protein CRUP_007783 [Coryphaenoides rupestris]|nr:hypothetical protein CRUP_007783 [Coryphaenoides rupestris]
MLIKEYRIPMPMSVEEYRIAQLYMIQVAVTRGNQEVTSCILPTKAAHGGDLWRLEVWEVLTVEAGGLWGLGGVDSGGWRSVVAEVWEVLTVEAGGLGGVDSGGWRYTCPFVEKFSIDIETYYKPDTGNQLDVFNMAAVEKRQRTLGEAAAFQDSSSTRSAALGRMERNQLGMCMPMWYTLWVYWPAPPGPSSISTPLPSPQAFQDSSSTRSAALGRMERNQLGMCMPMWYTLWDLHTAALATDPIDIVTDPVPLHEYKEDEDPRLYKSAKTQRGPLRDDWIEEYNNNPGSAPVMCAYKLCKVEFRYWGMQSKIERFIHDVGLRKVMVRAHRQAWCWQDEWYGLTMEDIRQLELETQLALATKMAQFSQADEADEGGGASSPGDKEKEAISGIEAEEEAVAVLGSPGNTLQARGPLTKQWSTSSRSSRSSKRGVSPSRHSLSEWRMQSIARDSEESSDDEEFFDAHEDLSDNEEVFPKEIAKWNSNDLIDKIEAADAEGTSGELFKEMTGDYESTASEERLDEASSKQADVNTLSGAFEGVMRVHYPTALGRIALRLGCLSSSQDHIPLAALPLLATSSPQYQEAVATVVVRANQVCLIGDCVGGILGFDALCNNNQPVSESQNSSRRGSVVSIQDQDLLSPGIIVNCGSASPNLEGSRHLSRSNIDIPRSASSASSSDEPKRQLPRKRSDSSTYEVDTIKQHHAFLSSSTMLDASSLGKFDFDVADFFLFGSPLGLVLALRKTVIPSWKEQGVTCCSGPVNTLGSDVEALMILVQLRPACQQVYNLFHPADPSASRLEPLLEKKFHLLPPFNVPRYQRFPLGDGNSALLVETVQSHAQLLFDSGPSLALRCQETISETCIPVPVLNWQDGPHRASPATVRMLFSLMVVSSMDNSYPSSPVTGPNFRAVRRAKRSCPTNQSKKFSLLSQLALTSQNKFFLMSPPKLRRKDRVQGPPKSGSDPGPVLGPSPDPEEDACGGLSPSSQFEPCHSAGLEHAISDLISLDSQAEVDQARWWGTKRMDFALYCPDALTAFPTVALPHLFHASYWESTDVVSLPVEAGNENSSILELDGKEVSEFTPSKPREKWLRKRTHVKIRNVTANHRVSDAVSTEGGQQLLTGRFMYGPLDMVTLTGEKVDLHIMGAAPLRASGWAWGVYPIKMVVRGDHTFADSYLTVLPRGTEFVVFSIDGSFAASVSIMGSDPKVRAGAVDVVRHWQDLGYLIIYVTGRPDMQKQRVVAWLSQHNFPHGIVSFCDGLVHDPLRHKANFLKSLTEAHMKIFAGYGSTKDISVYTAIGLGPSQIYIVGRPSKKMQQQCQFITEGYAAHLSQLEYHHHRAARPAKASGSARMVLRKSSFGLGTNSDFLRKRNHLLRTISAQPVPSSPTVAAPSGRPERTQSQSDSERLERERLERAQSQGPGGAGAGPAAAQRSMSITASCWGRSSSTKLEPGVLHPK